MTIDNIYVIIIIEFPYRFISLNNYVPYTITILPFKQSDFLKTYQKCTHQMHLYSDGVCNIFFVRFLIILTKKISPTMTLTLRSFQNHLLVWSAWRHTYIEMKALENVISPTKSNLSHARHSLPKTTFLPWASTVAICENVQGNIIPW